MDPTLDPAPQTWSARFDTAITELKSGMNGLRGALSAVESANADVTSAEAAVVTAKANAQAAQDNINIAKSPIVDSLDTVAGLIAEMKATLQG